MIDAWSSSKLFPSVIMVLYLLSVIMYSFEGNAKQVLYWVSAFLITFSVTWMK